MGILSELTGLREISKAVVGQKNGIFTEAIGDADGEAHAAVMGFAAASMTDAGDALGLGDLSRISFVGRDETCIVTLLGDAIVTTFVDPSVSVAGMEKKLDGVFSRHR